MQKMHIKERFENLPGRLGHACTSLYINIRRILYYYDTKYCLLDNNNNNNNTTSCSSPIASHARDRSTRYASIPTSTQ